MNIDNDDMDPAMDLGLTLGYATEFLQRTLNMDSGAGVNAGLRINIPFVSSNPLSELVWSPHNGLSIKCAESTFVDRSSILLGAGQSNIEDLRGQEKNLLTTIHVSEEVDDGNCSSKSPRSKVGESGHEHRRGEVKGNDLPIEQSLKIDCSHVHPINKCEASNITTTDLVSLGRKRRAEQASIVAEKSKSKISKSGLEKLESTDDNDLRTLTRKSTASKVVPSADQLQKDEEALPMDKMVSADHPQINRCRRKGKEKALSDGDVHGRMSEDSHGSVESCNSAKLFPTGKKRWIFEQLVMQSKRAKKEIQDATSFVRKDSSFMNWISNMVNGFGKPVEDKEPSTPLALAQPHHRHEHTGSLNMKSLYCSNTVVNDSRQSIEADHGESGVFCKQVIKEKLNESMSTAEAGLSTRPKTSLKTYALVLGKENEGMSSLGKHKTNYRAEKNDSGFPSEGKTTHILSNRSNALRSLWVTRFSPKTSDHPRNSPLEARDRPTEEPLTLSDRALQNATNAEASTGLDRISGHIDVNVSKLDSNLASQRPESSEAMASVFARRLDAIKHIIPSGATHDAVTACSFCGIRGHQLRECPKITGNELEDLLMNINLHSRATESSCLCIRCFQLNHLAVSCPNASREPRKMECDASLSMQGSTSKLQRIGGNKKALELNELVTSDRMISGSTFVNKCIASSSLRNEPREERIGPWNRQMPNMPTGIFDAMKRLRLSRTDILKWMNSDIPLSRLTGFLLRLRLGKREEGLGGTGYYVAFIDGSVLETSSRSSRNAIPVKVGSIGCLVGSQYISNHDFRDDELMAWWTAALRDGSKIPSEEELRARVEDKKMLAIHVISPQM